jgi:hypothetical protein
MPERSPLWSRATLLALAMTALGRAVEIHGGELGRTPYPTIAWLTIAIAIAAAAIFLSYPLPIGQREFKLTATLCILANFAQLATKSPDFYLHIQSFSELTPFLAGLLASAVLCGRVLAGEGRSRTLSFTALLFFFGFLGNWIIANSPDPNIDTLVFQTDSAAALLAGKNPYAIDFPQIYPPEMKVYGNGLVKNGRVQTGYPYLPETLLAITPASFLHLDIRYTHLAAMILSAILIAAAGGGARVEEGGGVLGYCAAMLLLTTPAIFLVLEKSWTEPITVMMLAATVFCGIRRPKLLPIALGLFLASKQYAPATMLLFFVGPRSFRETILILIKSALVALAITLPLALWNFPAFWQSALVLQFRQPFRIDSLSYLAWMGESFWPPAAIVLIPFTLLLASMAIMLVKRRTIGFATAVSFCFLLFFAFSKQAFANYYFFVIGAIACGIVD